MNGAEADLTAAAETGESANGQLVNCAPRLRPMARPHKWPVRNPPQSMAGSIQLPHPLVRGCSQPSGVRRICRISEGKGRLRPHPDLSTSCPPLFGARTYGLAPSYTSTEKKGDYIHD